MNLSRTDTVLIVLAGVIAWMFGVLVLMIVWNAAKHHYVRKGRNERIPRSPRR